MIKTHLKYLSVIKNYLQIGLKNQETIKKDVVKSFGKDIKKSQTKKTQVLYLIM